MATIVIPNFTTQKTMVGLNTYTYTIQTAGLHVCRMVVSKHQTSTLTASITQAGSVTATLATATAHSVASTGTVGQSSIILEATANCAVNDVISFVLTSSGSTDKELNTVKADMIVTRGSGN